MVKVKDKENLLQDVTLIRVVATLSLVLWHSYCSYICWGYGNSPLDGVYSKVFLTIIPDANMPLFTILSGYLFGYLLGMGKYSEFKPFLKNKIHRLFIPYLVLGFTINMLQIGRQTPKELLYGQPNHMWYCLMLFECFVLCWFSEKRLGRVGKYLNLLLALLSCVVVLKIGLGSLRLKMIGGVGVTAYYYCYFVFGLYLARYKDKFLSFARRAWPLLLAIVLLQTRLPYVLLFTSFAFSLLAFTIANSAILKSVIVCGGGGKLLVINVINRHSFGVYVFHQWIIWNITRWDVSHPYIHEHYILFPILLFVLVTLASLFLSWLSMKTSIGRYLLG